MCVCVCMHVCMSTCNYIHTHTNMHACMHTYIHTYIHTRTHVYVYTNARDFSLKPLLFRTRNPHQSLHSAHVQSDPRSWV